MKGRVNKIIKFSAVDGPGNRAAVFLQGCNLDCAYCHNPETINLCNHCMRCVPSCPAGALTDVNGAVKWDSEKCVNCDACIKVCPRLSSPKTRLMTAAEVFDEIGGAVHFIRGITVSGGECTLQSKFVAELFAIAKSHKLSTFIDSNGLYDFSEDAELMAVTDSVMLDVKAFNKDEHESLTGKTNEMVLRNLEYLGALDKLYEIRTVAIANLFDVCATVREASKRIAQYENTRYKLIKFRKFGVRKQSLEDGLQEPGDALMNELCEIATENGVRDVVII